LKGENKKRLVGGKEKAGKITNGWDEKKKHAPRRQERS